MRRKLNYLILGSLSPFIIIFFQNCTKSFQSATPGNSVMTSVKSAELASQSENDLNDEVNNQQVDNNIATNSEDNIPTIVNSTVSNTRKTYYTATTGNDLNNGGISSPFRTIKRALRELKAGDTLYIRGGVYAERLRSDDGVVIPSGTSWTNAVMISAYPNESVTLRPGGGGGVVVLRGVAIKQYIIFKGLTLDAINSGSESAVQIQDGSHHIRFQNCHITNSFQNGVLIAWGSYKKSSDYNEFLNCRVSNSGRDGRSQINGVNMPGPNTRPGFGRGHGFYIETSNNLVKNCTIHNNGEYGLKTFYGDFASGRRANYNTIRENVLYQNGQNTTRYGHPAGGGILLGTGTGNKAYNNVIYGIPSIYLHGIDTGYYAIGSLIYNNTIYDSGVGIAVFSNSSGAIIKNNIIYKTSYRLTMNNGVGTVWSKNLIGVDPKFVNSAARNFRLLTSSSPAANKGATLSEVKTDINGTARPKGSAYDIGAFESF